MRVAHDLWSDRPVGVADAVGILGGVVTGECRADALERGADRLLAELRRILIGAREKGHRPRPSWPAPDSMLRTAIVSSSVTLAPSI